MKLPRQETLKHKK